MYRSLAQTICRFSLNCPLLLMGPAGPWTRPNLFSATHLRRRCEVCICCSDLRNSSVETQSIVVLDFGAQYSQLIARRVREQNVFSVVLPCNSSIDQIKKQSPFGIILSGGPSSVYDKDAPGSDPQIFDLGVPVLGICYGLQFMAHALGGKVRAA